MTFTELSNVPGSQKIIILEIGLPIALPSLINYESGIWFIELKESDTHSSTFSLYQHYASFNTNNEKYNIDSVMVGNVSYQKMNSLADLRSQNASFYFDKSIQVIYFHFENFNPPFVEGGINIANTWGFSTEIDQESNDAYYNDVYYDPRIIGVPAISKSKDPLFYGIIRYQGGSVVLNNRDGYFDDWKDKDIFGQLAKLKFGFAGLAYDEFRTVFTGFVEDLSYNYYSININLQDKRKFLSRSLPIRKFETLEFPEMNEKNIGKPKPLAYGKIRNAPAFCTDETTKSRTNGTASSFTANKLIDDGATFSTIGVTAGMTVVNGVSRESTTVASVDSETQLTLNADIFFDGSAKYAIYVSAVKSFYFMDTADHPAKAGQTIKVYAAGDEIPPVSVSLTGGTFTTSVVDVMETDKLLDVTVDFIGADINNGLDVLKDIIDIYGGVEYLAANYNTAEWAAQTTLAADVGIYIDKEVKLSDIIEEMSRSIFGIFLVQDDGLYTFRVYTLSRAKSKTIKDDEWITNPEITINSEEFLTSAKVKYYRNESDDKDWYVSTNTDYQETAFGRFKVYNEKEFPTLLVDSADAVALGTSIMARSSEISPIITRKTKMQNVDLEVMDFIIANHERPSNAEYPKYYEIIGITKELYPNAEVSLTMKYVKEA